MPPSLVHRFGCAQPLPPQLQRFCRHRFFQSWPLPEWLPLHAARDRPQSLSRTLFSEGNPPCTRCRDKFRCVLFGGQILLPHGATLNPAASQMASVTLLSLTPVHLPRRSLVEGGSFGFRHSYRLPAILISTSWREACEPAQCEN